MTQIKVASDFSPLLKAVMERSEIPVVTEESAGAFVQVRGLSALFFCGDWERLAESNDVAVVLPELGRLAPGLAVAVVARSSERALQLCYRFNKFPALVFLRDGGYLGAILGMRAWSEYGEEIAEILSREVSDPPPYQFPEGCIVKTPIISETADVH
jgi:hydrogenase-1 operon protein HyaE